MSGCGRGDKPWPLSLLGDIGVGKTRAALLLLDWVDGETIYSEFSAWCERLLDAKFGRCDRRLTREMLWSDHRRATLVCLDDVGTYGDDRHQRCETLKLSLDRREGKPTVLTSNLTIEQIADAFDDRLADRICGGTAVWLSGKSQRTGL